MDERIAGFLVWVENHLSKQASFYTRILPLSKNMLESANERFAYNYLPTQKYSSLV